MHTLKTHLFKRIRKHQRQLRTFVKHKNQISHVISTMLYSVKRPMRDIKILHLLYF